MNEQAKKKIRVRREKECFAICDRAVWFYELPVEKRKEVEAWRAAWLKATETGIIPAKPAWIN